MVESRDIKQYAGELGIVLNAKIECAAVVVTRGGHRLVLDTQGREIADPIFLSACNCDKAPSTEIS